MPEETRNKLIYIIEVKSEEAMEIIKEHLDQEVTGTKGTKKEKLYKKIRGHRRRPGPGGKGRTTDGGPESRREFPAI